MVLPVKIQKEIKLLDNRLCEGCPCLSHETGARCICRLGYGLTEPFYYSASTEYGPHTIQLRTKKCIEENGNK